MGNLVEGVRQYKIDILNSALEHASVGDVFITMACIWRKLPNGLWKSMRDSQTEANGQGIAMVYFDYLWWIS